MKLVINTNRFYIYIFTAIVYLKSNLKFRVLKMKIYNIEKIQLLQTTVKKDHIYWS